MALYPSAGLYPSEGLFPEYVPLPALDPLRITISAPVEMPELLPFTTDGYLVPNRATVLIVRNTGASARTLTVRATITVSGLAVAPRTVSIPAGSTGLLLLGSPAVFGRTTHIDASPTVEIAAITL